MIAGWKVSRELNRLGQQLRAIPEALWEPIAQRRHDAAFARGFRETAGQVPLGARVAIVLIWQPAGVPASVIAMCAHLRCRGYAVLAVSNATLSDSDRLGLGAEVWRFLERPNFGYDFGGYRDGLALLRGKGVVPDRLVILNDSVWYPLDPADDTLERMERCAAEVVGTVLRVRGKERFLESYFYSIGPGAIRHPAFAAFWQGLRLTSNKYKVIRRGERGFGRAMAAAGLTQQGLFQAEAFAEKLALADPALLRANLRHAAIVDPARAATAARLSTLQAEGWAERVRDFVAETLTQAQFYSTFPVAARRLMGYPVLKKSREPVSAVWRRAFCNAVREKVIDAPPPCVWQEIQAGFAREDAA